MEMDVRPNVLGFYYFLISNYLVKMLHNMFEVESAAETTPWTWVVYFPYPH